jgi:hypothetical protein
MFIIMALEYIYPPVFPFTPHVLASLEHRLVYSPARRFDAPFTIAWAAILCAESFTSGDPIRHIFPFINLLSVPFKHLSHCQYLYLDP